VAEGARGGRGKCRACNSEKQDEINKQLALGVSLRKLERRYGISHQALLDHKNHHLSPALVALTREKRLEGSARSVADQLEDLLDEVRSMYEAAKKSRNFQQALAALGKLLSALELQAKITGELDDRPQVTVNLQQTQEWIELRTVIFEVLQPYPEIRTRLSNRLRVLEGRQA
jgi:hypothetical protein